MKRARTVGLVVAAVATLLWLLFLAALLTADPDDGANIGAGLAALLALPLSVISSVVLLASLLRRSPVEQVPSRRTPERVAAALAVVSVAAFGAFLVLDPYAASAAVRMVTLAVGVATFLSAATTFAWATRRRV